MDLRPVELDHVGHRHDLARIYEASFPSAERLPLALLLAGTGGRVLTLAVEGERVFGFASTLPHHSVGVVLLEYLAADPGHRGTGVGGQILDHVVEQAGDDDVLAEIEPPDSSPDAERRARFYRRHDFEPAPWQGEYGMPDAGGGSVRLDLWHRAGHEIVCAPVDLVREVYVGTYGERGRPHLERVLGGIR